MRAALTARKDFVKLDRPKIFMIYIPVPTRPFLALWIFNLERGHISIGYVQGQVMLKFISGKSYPHARWASRCVTLGYEVHGKILDAPSAVKVVMFGV